MSPASGNCDGDFVLFNSALNDKVKTYIMKLAQVFPCRGLQSSYPSVLCGLCSSKVTSHITSSYFD